MPRKRLTAKFCKTVKPAEKPVEYWDTYLTGMSLLVSPRGKRTFYTKFRTHGKQRRRQIGPYPIVTLDEARDRAREILNNATRGIDITRHQEAPRSVADLSRLYLEYRSRNSKNTSEIARMHRRFIVPELGHVPLSQLTRNDVRSMVQRIGEATPVQANRTLSEAKAMLNWGVAENFVSVNVAAPLKPVVREKPRDRVLSDVELSQILLAADKGLGHPWRTLVPFLVLTGARRGEAAALKWSDIENDIWTVPSERYKTAKAHTVPLSATVQKILRQTPQLGEFVFGVVGRAEPKGWGVAKRQLDALLDTQERWTWHDLRRSMRTGLSKIGVEPHIAELVIGHAVGGSILRTYDRFAYLEQRRDAMERWAQHILGLFKKKT